MKAAKINIWQARFVIPAIKDSFKKLNPLLMARNPVMFIVELVSIVTTLIVIGDIVTGRNVLFNLQISLWLWFTIIFANFSEALAEGQGRAQADSLKKNRSESMAKRLVADGTIEIISALKLRKGDIIILEDGDTISGDGDVIEGTALIDESAITGESAPVIRESGGDRSGVTGGTRVLSGKVRARISANPGESFLDQMINMVESAKRQKTPNEKALNILLIALTIVFVVVVATFKYFANYSSVSVSLSVLIALLVCLMPTTIGGLLPAIGIAGMDRLLQYNFIAMSGRAVEASGDVDIVLMDKTGTITLGNRMATEFIAVNKEGENELIHAALLSSLADDTPEGRSIVVLAKEKLGMHGSDIRAPEGAVFCPFTAEARMSGIDCKDRKIRKGSMEAIREFVAVQGSQLSDRVQVIVNDISREGSTPLLVTQNEKILGAIRLKDVLKEGISGRIAKLRQMGIKSIMITGDNPLTAATIAAEAGVDDFVAEAKPATKLELIRRYQNMGHLVAMIGDGTNDAPALAQADVAVAMNAGTQAAREAANIVDLDSNPTKLLDVVEIGKQILITRGALTTFSVANDVAKYFAIVPAIFIAQYPQLELLNVMHLSSSGSAVLSAVIFNAIIIPLLIPLALRGVRYKPSSASALLRRNLLVYGLGGLFLPFVGIKLIDIIISFFRMA
jgi:K+-transporting ATPase ATPase B chain